MPRRLLLSALVPALLAVLLAIDPPAPRNAAARSSLAPATSTGAPGEGDCLDCHGLSLNDGVGSVAIAVAGLSSGAYQPGQTYDVTVTVTRGGSLRWGFSMTALRNSDNAMSGTFTQGTDNFTNTRTGTVTGQSRTYIGHTTGLGADGTFDNTGGPANCTFKWTAPAAGAGAVTLYVCGLACDSDGGTSDADYPYTSTLVMQEGVPTATLQTTWGALKTHYR